MSGRRRIEEGKKEEERGTEYERREKRVAWMGRGNEVVDGETKGSGRVRKSKEE